MLRVMTESLMNGNIYIELKPEIVNGQHKIVLYNAIKNRNFHLRPIPD